MDELLELAKGEEEPELELLAASCRCAIGNLAVGREHLGSLIVLDDEDSDRILEFLEEMDIHLSKAPKVCSDDVLPRYQEGKK
jgi:hypothetical protein